MYDDNIYMRASDDRATLEIVLDLEAESPREWSNLGTMLCWHRHYNLGDRHNYQTDDDFWFSMAWHLANNSEDVKDMTQEEIDELVLDNIIILPLYLLDHSGITMSIFPFNDPWDSGQVGWIYVTHDDVKREYGVEEITEDIEKKVLKTLEAEVEVYDAYLRGAVFGYIIKDHNGDIIDSCWGFYGNNPISNGMYEQIPEEYRDLLYQLR